ncbi:hypothetical protein PX701_09575 [Agromyces sp. H3Y2-19a]|uniref:hypothetical protein n=1 Tax=Agromyces chromiiresistens TaxID=3030835 RepID=UPI0023B90B8E|nr:hypothetical protein [Agromyces chromiiresistens]MDF0513869.1 hypothetical protein [Agromyces chromiiresistens]
MPDRSEAPTRAARLRSIIATERFRWWMVYVVLAMVAAVRAASPQERDQYWSARAGIESLEGSPFIRPDTWSWATDGEWVPNSPVWNIVLGLGWQVGGFWGLFWVAFVSISVFFALALLLARLAGARAFPTLIGFTPVLVFAFSAFTPRATVVVQSLTFVAVLFAWWWSRQLERRSSLVAVGVVAGFGFVLSLVGNWLHLSFMLMAAVIAVMWAVAWWATPGMTTVRRVFLAAAGAAGLFLGCVGSPYGIGLTLERSRVVAEVCRGLVSEWFSIIDLFRLQGFRFIPFAIVAILVAAGALIWTVRLVRRDGRFDPRTRIAAPLVAFGVPAVVLGLDSLRFTLSGLLVLLPVAGCVATGLIDRLHRLQGDPGHRFLSRPKVVEYTSGRFWTVIIAGLMVMATPVVVLNTAPGATPPEVDVIRQLPKGCKVWSADPIAGPVILLRPDAEVWIDGRADFYGREHLLEYLRILWTEDPLPDATGCVILPSNEMSERLAAALDADMGWHRVASERGFTLWVRG